MKTIIKSAVLDTFYPDLEIAAKAILTAVENRRPILIRHHLDSDGYTGGFALESAIAPLVNEMHTRERDAYYYLKRLPSKTPFYSQEDALRDISNFTDVRSSSKPPLIIICDNGSGKEDLDAIKLVKMFGAEVIVVDHHPPYPEIDEHVVVQVNPHKVGSTYDYCTGMLCAELGYMINPKVDLTFIAAVGGVADRVESDEFFAYLKRAEKIVTKEHVYNTAECLDYLGFILNTLEGREIVRTMLQPLDKNNLALIRILRKEIQEKKKLQLKTNLAFHEKIELDDKILGKLNISHVRTRAGYPPRGKTTGMLHDHLKEKNDKPVITMGYTSNAISFRCSTEIEKFDVNEIIALIKKKIPQAQVQGGGHRVAGSISFVEAAYNDVMEFVMDYCKNV